MARVTLRPTMCSLTVLTAALTMVGCAVGAGVNGADGSLVFASEDEACQSISLRNEVQDEAVLAAGVSCIRTEYEAGRAFTWDARLPTVEGDPTYYRHRFDGERVTITSDTRRDEFGIGRVERVDCAGLSFTNAVPQGIDCDEPRTVSGSEGFLDAGPEG